MEAYKFRDAVNERTIYVAWQNPVTTGLFTDLRIPARTAIVRSVMNESVAVWDGDDGDYDGMVEIEVGSRPIYIEVEWSKQKE